MSTPLLDQAIALASDTRQIVLGENILEQTGKVFTETTSSRHGIVVADETTWKLAGEQVTTALTAAGIRLEEPLIFPALPPVYAGYENVVIVREKLRETGATACSIGSGTISDLVKLASGELERPYVHVCTATSMDGYAAFGAAITKDGFKITRTCPAPAGIVADMAIMSSAPPRMTANGYADLIEKFPGGADWIVADALGVEPIDETSWNLVQQVLPQAMSAPAALAEGDRKALLALTEECMLSGLAIQAHKSSRPGSGAGHNFSHQWEMEGYGLDWPLPLSHGAKVGLGTIAVAALYDMAIERGFDAVDADAVVAAWPNKEENELRVRNLHTFPVIAEAAVLQSQAKYVPVEELGPRIAAIKGVWSGIAPHLREQVPTASECRDMLKEVGAVWHPSQIGISLDKLKHTYLQAQTLRSRYTLLDVLQETGLLIPWVEELFAPGGFWAEEEVPTEGVIVP